MVNLVKAVHEEYDITLLLFSKSGSLLREIPENVEIITPKNGFHIAIFDQLADVGGRDAQTVFLLLRHDDAGEGIRPAEICQLLGITLALVTEAEIIAADEADCTLCPEIFQKIKIIFRHGVGDQLTVRAGSEPDQISDPVDQNGRFTAAGAG